MNSLARCARSLVITKLQTKFYQNRKSDQKQIICSILSNEVKIAKFSDFFFFRGPQFSTFSTFIVILKVDDERNWMTFVLSKSAFYFKDIQRPNRPQKHPRPPALGGRICPSSWFLQNNSKTNADIDTKFCVTYPTSIWHRMTNCGRNRSENFREIDDFVGSLHANFDQNRFKDKEIRQK